MFLRSSPGTSEPNSGNLDEGLLELLHDATAPIPSDLSITHIAATSMSHIDLSKLQWIKVIHDPSGWAYTRQRLKEMPHTVDFNYVTVFPLGFRTDKANHLTAADQVALIQNGKLTHLVEILDCEAYEGGGWYHRICRVLWWRPDLEDWGNLSPQSQLLGFDPALQDGEPHLIESLKRFGERWNDNGKMPGFRAYLAERL